MSPSLSSSAAVPVNAGKKTPAWYCVRVLARREHATAENLRQRTGSAVFSPRISLRRERRSGELAVVSEPLFPGYVFARFHYPEEARHIASTPGVIGLVAFGGPPVVVADEVIAQLDAAVQRAAAPQAPSFAEGAWVRIVTGCFRGREGRVTAAADRAARVCVLLNLLGQTVQVSVPADQLAGADEFPQAMPDPGRPRANPAAPALS